NSESSVPGFLGLEPLLELGNLLTLKLRLSQQVRGESPRLLDIFLGLAARLRHRSLSLRVSGSDKLFDEPRHPGRGLRLLLSQLFIDGPTGALETCEHLSYRRDGAGPVGVMAAHLIAGGGEFHGHTTVVFLRVCERGRSGGSKRRCPGIHLFSRV